LQRAIDLARQTHRHEEDAAVDAAGGVWEAFYGNGALARQRSSRETALSKGQDVAYLGALTLALLGDDAAPRATMGGLEKRFPEDTSVQFSYLPGVRAQLALNGAIQGRRLPCWSGRYLMNSVRRGWRPTSAWGRCTRSTCADKLILPKANMPRRPRDADADVPLLQQAKAEFAAMR
jgi:hypothetical protein